MIYPNQISQWKAYFLQNVSSVFSGPKNKKKEFECLEKECDILHKLIGEKEVDIDFLKKLCKASVAAIVLA